MMMSGRAALIMRGLSAPEGVLASPDALEARAQAARTRRRDAAFFMSPSRVGLRRGRVRDLQPAMASLPNRQAVCLSRPTCRGGGRSRRIAMLSEVPPAGSPSCLFASLVFHPVHTLL